MLTRLRKNLVEANYGVLGLEFIIVILSILIAFQIDRWGQERRDREQEYQYLVRLQEDLRFEIQRMTDSFGFADRRIAAVRLLEEVSVNPELAVEKPESIAQALERATWRSFPHIGASVYTELQSTGSLSLIRSDALRLSLAEYYASLRFESQVGLDLNIEHSFDRLTAGILTTAEVVDVEESGSGRLQNKIQSERGLEIAREFAARQGAVDLLPSIAQHHMFNKKVIEASRDKAHQINAMIDSLIRDFHD